MQVAADAFWAAEPDPVAAFSKPVCGHMNADHADSTKAIVQHYTGIAVDSATMTAIDRLGFDTDCKLGEDTFSIRLAYPERADDRKAVKDRIVQMSQAAAQSQQ